MRLVEYGTRSYQVALDKILPVIQKNTKRSYIRVALVLITLHRIYSYFRVPRQLRHIVSLPFLSMEKSFYYREPPYSRFKRLILPVIKKDNGFYLSKVPFGWTVHVIDPVAAKQILMKAESSQKSHDFMETMGPNSPFVRLFGKDSVGIDNGQSWKKNRKIMNPVFHRPVPIETMASVVPTFFSFIEKNSYRVYIGPAMKNFTLDVLGFTIFGVEFKALKGDPEHWSSNYALVNKGMSDPLMNVMGSFGFLVSLFSPKRKSWMDAVTRFNAKLAQMVEQRRKEVDCGLYSSKSDKEKDLLTLMLEAKQRGEGASSDEELSHNMAGLFLAGHDGIAHTLAFCLYHLAKNKDVQDKLREHVISILGDAPIDIKPTLEQLKSIEYLDLVIKENLRHNAPADSLLPRIAKEDVILNGTLVPKGTTLNVDIYAIHHDPRSWESVDKFIPERFAKGGEYDNHEGLTWLPFSNGSRQCIGLNFSMVEQRLVLAMLVRKYEIDIPIESTHREHVVVTET
ncbi:cytochrome P450-dit2, partial [Rhizopus stolonifer]